MRDYLSGNNLYWQGLPMPCADGSYQINIYVREEDKDKFAQECAFSVTIPYKCVELYPYGGTMRTAFDKKFRRGVLRDLPMRRRRGRWSIFNSLNMIANDPATIGRAAGEIVKGYRETVKETLP